MISRLSIFLVLILTLTTGWAKPPREIWERYNVAFIGKENSPANGPAKQGARDAATILEHQYKLAITINDLTPNPRNGLDQAAALQEAFIMNAQGVLISVSDPAAVKEGLEMLAKNGVFAVTFNGDAPDSPRLATIHSDEVALGKAAMDSVIGQMPRGGALAILAGGEDDPALQQRLQGLREVAEANTKFRIQGVYHCGENFQEAMGLVTETMQADRDQEIDGWVFLGPWPLMGATPLPWEPGNKVCVSVDALPPQLAYLGQEQVDVLIAQMYYRWGYLAMDAAINAIHLKKAPEERIILTGSEVITSKELADYSQDWLQWMQ